MSKKSYLGLLIDETLTQKMPIYSSYLVESHYRSRKNPDETVQESYARAALAFSSNLAHAQRLYDYCSNNLFMFASPLLSNAPLPDEKPTALNASCFLPLIGDDIPSLLFQKVESSLLTVLGGGIGQTWSLVRPTTKKSTGVMPMIHELDAGMLAWKQQEVRRGSACTWLTVEHPEFKEFLNIRKPTGDSQRKAFNIHHGAVISDSFMQAVVENRDYNQIMPHNGEVFGVANAAETFKEINMMRSDTGEPFLEFIDNVNKEVPLPQRMLGMYHHGSNLCSEITLVQDKDRTPVCFLSSINLEKWDDIEDKRQFIHDLVEMLDNAIQFFIDNALVIAKRYEDENSEKFIASILRKVLTSVTAERSMGLGVMGWSYYLQRNMIPFESETAVKLAGDIMADIKGYAHEKSCMLGIERGVPSDISNYIEHCKQNGIEVDEYWRHRRNLNLLAIAPTSNNSVILDTTPSTEPAYANIYSNEMRIGIFTIKNRYLEKLLESKGKNTKEVWDSISDHDGTVEHLDFLTDYDKSVFKVALDIDPYWQIRHNLARTPHVCQAQSFNLYVKPATDINYLSALLIYFWKNGGKTVYYNRTESPVKFEKLSKDIEREIIKVEKKSIVYGSAVCPKCDAVKKLLTANGIEFEYVDLQAIGKTAAQVTGRQVRSIPQVYIDSEYIGGLEDVINHFKNKAQQEAIAASGDECKACEG